VAGLEFNKEHAHSFFLMWRRLFTMNLFLLTLWSTLSYCEVLRRLRGNVKRKRPELWCNHNWFHHDNMPTHTSLKATEFVTNSNIVVIPNPPYSPDLAPGDFALFPKFKIKLKGWCFETMSDIQRELQAILNSITENDFHSAFEVWKKWWNCCIHSKGNSF
jgi:hypothetical protein